MRRALGVVLAGGKSSRFGEDKALAEFGGSKLVERAVGAVRAAGLEAAVVTRPGRDYSFLGCRVEFDRVADQGPLGGLCTAFEVFPSETLLVLTCDMPNLAAEALALLLAAAGDDGATLFRAPAERLEPFPGVYPASLARTAAACLESGDVSMHGFLAQVPSVRFVEPPPDGGLFLNINRKPDLKSGGG